MPKPDVNKDYYAILDIKSDANIEEIKKAYHKLGEFIVTEIAQRLTIG